MRKVFFFCLASMLCLVANAQTFIGNHPLQLSATGTVSQTTLNSDHVVSSLTMSNHTWEILFKTETLKFGANATQLQVLNNVFSLPSNRLMTLTIDVQSANFNFSNNLSVQNLPLAGQLHYNNLVAPVPVMLNLSYNKVTNEFTYTFSGNVNLTNLGLSAANASADFNDNVIISGGGSLTKR